MSSSPFESPEIHNAAVYQQYDADPYPHFPIEQLPEHPQLFADRNFTTPYYLRYGQVLDPKGKVFLDMGCGSGFKTLALALNHPGAKVVGVDFSPRSIAMAQERAKYHKLDDRLEFHCGDIDALGDLGYQFDFITCDEVLYLVADPLRFLQVFQSLLTPQGIIRGNFHSRSQRHNFYQAQTLLKAMGIFHEEAGDLEVGIIREIFTALKDGTSLKNQVWSSQYPMKEQSPAADEAIRMNFILQGDRGFTFPEIQEFLEQAHLEFLEMVDWKTWNLYNLFNEPDNLPAFLGMALPETDRLTQLYIFDHLQPIHRLLDFWCGHPQAASPSPPVAGWTPEQWQQSIVHLHPNLCTDEIRAKAVAALQSLDSFPMGQVLPIGGSNLMILYGLMRCLMPLFEQPMPFPDLVAYYLRLNPIDPITGDPTTEDAAISVLTSGLMGMEQSTHILLCLPEP
jgi:2-polyprenyl-3-methyl-5-hydroxy-6-metoxy-1,4-benzoquinol methylase